MKPIGVLGLACVLGSLLLSEGVRAAQGGDDPDLLRLLAEERQAAESMLRRGEARGAQRRLEELLGDRPADAEGRTLLGIALFAQADYPRAELEARKALSDAASLTPAVRATCARNLARILVALGRPREALSALEPSEKDLAPEVDARGAWALASAAFEAGDRPRARRYLELGAAARDDAGPEELRSERLLARGQCQRRLGRLEDASKSLVAALESEGASSAGAGQDPEVRVALGDLYFEADKEVEAGSRRSASGLYKEALRLNPTHEGARLGLYRLHRYNWQRQSKSAAAILDEVLAACPGSVEALAAGASADLDDGNLKSARERLSKLSEIAPGRRDVRGLRAALLFVEHKGEECERILAELAAEDAQDSSPEREVGRHLSELYRFAEGLPYARRAVKRDEHDWEAWKELGRALANTGDEDEARKALDRASEEARGRADAWRDNLRLVLSRMAIDQKRETHGELTFAWNPDAAPVLRTYVVPFYAAERAELARRYGFTPGPTTIEIFDKHRDFSVRSTGFEGFPALGVCFGPVVTAVSPLFEMRGTQSWARTSWHEFTHVVHLGLSHNRCPRWVTEGLATWEEENKNPSWSRNMRRELIDALANDEVIRVRELNRAFRSSRILFGYYQGGLLCRMLIERRGFPPMVKLLEAFDRGLDLDQAFAEVYQTTPEDLDRDFSDFARRLTADLKIEPRWSEAAAERLRARLAREKSADHDTPEKLRSWAEGWCTVAWAAWQDGRKVDALEALRAIAKVDPPPARALLLRGEMALKDDDREKAAELWGRALSDVEDFRARIALGVIAKDKGDLEAAEKQFLAAEKDFPGFDDDVLSAELHLQRLYVQQDRADDSMRALERWLACNAGALPQRRKVAAWHMGQKRFDAAAKLLDEANQIDPFLRRLHREWGDALRAGGKDEEALREYTVGLAVPPELDSDKPGEVEDQEKAEWLGLQAACLQALGRNAEAAERAKKALELDPDCAIASETLRKAQ